MSSVVSFEYLNSIIATLDEFKGELTDDATLIAAFPIAAIGDYAYIRSTNSFWYWNNKLDTPAWVNQNIKAPDYLLLSESAKSAVPYVIVP